jgi:polysaccharide deacetylase
MPVSRILAFHAEKLHDDRVWQRVQRVAQWMSCKRVKATFFVYPYRAQVVAQDISDRVRMLSDLGHEVGQHTHFYAGTKIDKPGKVDDLSDANISRCLHRDFETLQHMGHTPKGFTAGAWFVNEAILDTLTTLGFTYDCSARFPQPKTITSLPFHRWLQTPQPYVNPGGRMLCLPTLCSLGEWYKWGRKTQIGGQVPYQLVYLHDYDLLPLYKYLSLWCFLRIMAVRNMQPLAFILDQYAMRG